VLRKKPPGQLLARAHAVEREYAVLSALARDGRVPVPQPLAVCHDAAVLGTPFYLMAHVRGRVFTDPALPGLQPAERGAVYTELARVLATLHAVRPAEVGLAGFGGQAGGAAYSKRQVETWARQWRASAAAVPPPEAESAAMLALTDWLRREAPSASRAPTLVHGDFRLDNLVFSPAEEPGPIRCLAVLDWELSTLGEPEADLAYACLAYRLPPGGGAAYPCFGAGGPPPGVPSEAQQRAAYFRGARDEFHSNEGKRRWTFYLALALFRGAAILAGVRARAAAGNAAQAAGSAARAGAVASLLAHTAAGLAGLGPSAAPSAAPVPGGSRLPQLLTQLRAFMAAKVYPAEAQLAAHAASDARWSVHPLVEELKAAARKEGLWNLWLPADAARLLKVPLEAEERDLMGPGLSNAEYCRLAEVTGGSPWAPELFNCSAPDTGNMEVLLRYGSAAQQRRWLLPLLRGAIRSCFAMTEPAVASSDATNICARISAAEPGPSGAPRLRINGRKWWASGACDPRCALAIFMGRSDVRASAPPHAQQSMVLVPMGDCMADNGVRVLRPLLVFGYDDAPHGHAELMFEDTVVEEAEALLLGHGRGFEIAQGRLGPGRLHHCMRLLGAAERGMALAVARAQARTAFGRTIAEQGAFGAELARRRLALEQARLATLEAARALDASGGDAKAAAGAIAMAKLAAPAAALACLDFAIQTHGAAGVSADTPLAYLWAGARTLRLADGPDEVHLQALARLELRGRLARL